MPDKKKRFAIKTTCPQCGCSGLTAGLSAEEIEKRYGHLPNVALECGECMIKYEESWEKACPEWDQECKLRQ